MRRLRSQCYTAVRCVKHNQTNVKNSLATALLGNKTRDFWKEVGNDNKSNTTLPNLIDDVTGDENISKLFATKYDE